MLMSKAHAWQRLSEDRPATSKDAGTQLLCFSPTCTLASTSKQWRASSKWGLGSPGICHLGYSSCNQALPSTRPAEGLLGSGGIAEPALSGRSADAPRLRLSVQTTAVMPSSLSAKTRPAEQRWLQGLQAAKALCLSCCVACCAKRCVACCAKRTGDTEQYTEELHSPSLLLALRPG